MALGLGRMKGLFTRRALSAPPPYRVGFNYESELLE